MASDASFGPQDLSLLLKDIECAQEQQVAGSFFSISRGRIDVQDKQDDLESVSSTSIADVNLRKINFQKVYEYEHSIALRHIKLGCSQSRGMFYNLPRLYSSITE